ncbi:uncharacterized protein FSUBG_13512 [Fusarium subglutinans]|uniref:Uncharacterized protein n=1 Tax=Gibberella subglutinans TaxID=42677 RepID=A0A8H5NWW1_GIBSU|nr:uncharacterized protein FSUBG_13512 [Fusarium subglutinans]KAF5579908.1 hypothetical protein FSUBG_13512 [Fusarium subglutinans]
MNYDATPSAFDSMTREPTGSIIMLSLRRRLGGYKSFRDLASCGDSTLAITVNTACIFASCIAVNKAFRVDFNIMSSLHRYSWWHYASDAWYRPGMQASDLSSALDPICPNPTGTRTISSPDADT